MEGLILLFIGLIVFGLLLSLVALFPPLRKWTSSNRRRSFLTILIALLAFVFAFLILSPMVARVNVFFVCRTIDEWDGVFHCSNEAAQVLGYRNSEALSEAVYQELWKRLLVPSLLQKPCYAQNLSLCTFIDNERKEVGEHIELLLIIAFIPGLVAGISVWWWTRPLKPDPDQLVAGT
jgi:hypothetical protein